MDEALTDAPWLAGETFLLLDIGVIPLGNRARGPGLKRSRGRARPAASLRPLIGPLFRSDRPHLDEVLKSGTI